MDILRSALRCNFFPGRLLLLLPLLLLLSHSPVRAQFTINSYYGNLEECDTMTRNIYIVWWDKDFNYGPQVNVLLDSMISYRTTCLEELQMADPPNTEDGYFYNVYIHTPGNSNCIFYPYGWGNGQGTDPNGYPFLTLPNGVLTDWLNNAHETFHIFQYNANSPGFSYSGDSQWYIEASANWFAAKENISEARAFVEAESLVRIPHVPLWLSYGNFPASYPQNWQRYVHQYALALLLYYLTDVGDVPDQMIIEGFFNGTTQLPQEYLFNQLGSTAFRDHFMGWAAHMTNDFDFIEPYQAATNLNEWNTYADPLDDNEYILILDNEGTDGWYSPDDTDVTTAWSYNTYKLLNTNTASYTFELNASSSGSSGDDAFFQGMVVVQNSLTGTGFHALEMSSSTEGSITLDLSPDDSDIFFVIASMPEVFEDNNPEFQLFHYVAKITAEITGVRETPGPGINTETGRYNSLGQPVHKEEGGVQVIHYDDGSTKKVFVPR